MSGVTYLLTKTIPDSYTLLTFTHINDQMKVNRYFTIIIFLLGSLFAIGQTTSKYSNEFLSIGVGARAFAMGNSVAASTSDENSAYWNPAGLTQLQYPINIGIMHAEYFAGLAQYDFGALAFKPDNNSAIGISLIRFGVDNIPNTTQLVDEEGNLRFDLITAFSAADYAFLFSYARNLKYKGLSVGGNVKIVRRVAGDFAEAWGFGIDLAAQYKKDQWQFGLVLRDITTTFNSWSFNTTELAEVFELTGNTIPTTSTELTMPKIILGGTYRYPIYNKFSALAELTLDISTDGKRNVLISGDPFSIDPHVGIELDYNQIVFVRFGINNLQKEDKGYEGNLTYTMQPNLGLGVKYKRFRFDYALTDLGDVSAAGYSHIFSLAYAIKSAGSNNQTKITH